MGQLEYDNSAFYYFMISMLSLYLVPGWWYTSKTVLAAFSGSGGSARSELEKVKEAKLKTNQKGAEKLNNRAFLINLLSLCCFSMLFIFLVFQVMGDSSIASFDPYEILSVDRGATDKQIKKAYKLKALEYHPDKNIGNKHAEQMFMMIAKAYEALTDEEAKANWEKFGNPDGKQSFEMSIGLPTFLMEKANHNWILIVYLLLMVVVVPSVVWAYWKDSQMYGEGNVMYKTYQTYANLLLRQEKPTEMRFFPEVFATAAEFEGVLTASASDQEQLRTWHGILKGLNERQLAAAGGNNKKKKAPKAAEGTDDGAFMAKASKWLEGARSAPGGSEAFWRIMKGNIALHVHLARCQLEAKHGKAPALSAAWTDALDKMLVQAPSLLAAILAISSESKKYETMMNAMKFSQCLTQGLWPRGGVSAEACPFYQVPHVGAAEAGAMADAAGSGGLKAFLRAKFDTFAAETRKAEPELDDDEVWGLWAKMGPKDHAKLDAQPQYERPGLGGMSDAQRLDVETVCSVLPDMDVECRPFVYGEDFVCERDTVTLEVTLTRRHVAEGGKAPPVHAPHFPVQKKAEEWWVVLKAEDERINPWVFMMEKVTDQSQVSKTEVKFPAPPLAGAYKYTVHVVSDSYVGLDHAAPFVLEVAAASELPEVEDAYEDEDIEAETALEATFGAGNVDSDVSDSDAETDDDDKEEEKPAAAKKKAAVRAGGSDDAVMVESADADSSEEELD